MVAESCVQIVIHCSFSEVRFKAWLYTFYLAPLSGCSDPSLSDRGILGECSVHSAKNVMSMMTNTIPAS